MRGIYRYGLLQTSEATSLCEAMAGNLPARWRTVTPHFFGQTLGFPLEAPGHARNDAVHQGWGARHDGSLQKPLILERFRIGSNRPMPSFRGASSYARARNP